MPLSISAATSPNCALSLWEIANSGSFIDSLAWLYLRKPNHALKIIAQLAPGPAGFPGNEFSNAIELLEVKLSDISASLGSSDPAVAEEAGKTRFARVTLRDGLLFQHISWVAASIQFPNAKARPPHVRKADKGFDGLLVELGALGGALGKLVLCEDKATINPRTTITGGVWPEIKKVEAGDKDLELLDAVTAILDTLVSEDIKEQVLGATLWEKHREYRVALTAAPSDLKGGSYQHIFAGYEDQVLDNATNRMAEVMPLADFRAELQSIASQVIAKLVAMALVHV